MKTNQSRFFAVLLVSVAWVAWGGCHKQHKPSGGSWKVRCTDLADDFAGALQDSGRATGPRGDKVIGAFHDKLREFCIQRRFSKKVFSCVARAAPGEFSKMVSCLPRDVQETVPSIENSGGDESGDSDEEDQE